MISFHFSLDLLLAAALGINLVAATVIAGMFALINYQIKNVTINQRVAAPAGDFDDEDEEDI